MHSYPFVVKEGTCSFTHDLNFFLKRKNQKELKGGIKGKGSSKYYFFNFENSTKI
jgi:hypothetical protein